MNTFMELIAKLFGNDAIKAFVINILVKLVGGQIPNELMVKIGTEHGKWITAHAREALGDGWENLEDEIQDKLDNYILGLDMGLNSDDEVPNG